MPVELKSPVGRIVWGNPGKATTKKDQKGQVVMKDGKPIEQWAFGLAIPKAEFEAHVWPLMAQEAATGYPTGVPQAFSWKYKDGDNGIDRNGKPYRDREGYPGCYVLTIMTEAFAPPIFKLQQNGTYAQLTGDQIKTGDYVAAALSFKVNVPTDRTHTPGLYVNPVAIDHVGYGQPIINGPDAQTLFGGQHYQLPAGASATPVAAAGAPGMPGTMQQPQPGGMPMQQPGMMPGNPMQQPQPGGYAAPGMVPSSVPAGMPGNGAMPLNNGPTAMNGAYPSNPAPMQPQQPEMMPAPAPDFTRNAGMQPQQPGMMPAPAPQYQQPMPGGMPQMQPGMMPQPGAMPGMMPGR